MQTNSGIKPVVPHLTLTQLVDTCV